MIYTPPRLQEKKTPFVWVGLGDFPFENRLQVPWVIAENFSGYAQRRGPSRHPTPACWEGLHLGLQGPLPSHKWLSPSLPAQDQGGRYPRTQPP